MNDMWWALNREKELKEYALSATQFIEKLTSILDKYEHDPDKPNSKIREAIEDYKKRT